MENCDLYKGIKEITDHETIAFIYNNKNLDFLTLNEYVIIKDDDGFIKDRKRFDGEKLVQLRYYDIKNFKPKSVKQECAFDLMSNKEIPIKIIAGIAGSGKTKIALKFGFYFLDRNWVDKIFIIRHNVPVGERNGYFKGEKEEKLLEWMGSIKDNMLYDEQLTLEEFIQKGTIEVEAVECIKGRDIKNAWILVDECEDLTAEQFKVIGERVSEGSYICFVGDYNQISQDKYKKDNGLKRAFKTLKGYPQVGFITFDSFDDDIRSEVSKLFAYKY